MSLELPADSFRRYDETPDTWFYSQPRLVEHIDAGAIAPSRSCTASCFPPALACWT